jgi:N utilization substance protein A
MRPGGVMSKDKEIKIIIDAVSNEKDINKEVVFEALEEALAAAHQKHLDDERAQIEVLIDRKTGEIMTARIWDVVLTEEEVTDPSVEVTLENALTFDQEAQVGKKIRQMIESIDLGRISAQVAKQAVYQKLKTAKKEKLASYYENQVGQLVTGTVKKATRDVVLVELSNGAEAILPRREMIPKETFRLNDRVRALIKEVIWEKKGPIIMLSRAHPQMLAQLFAIEVPEIGQGTIEIRAVARDPGLRAKVAVQAKDSRIEPKGACIGMRGSRINSVMEEIGGERIDIILWDSNDAQFVVNALAPAEVTSIVVDEQLKLMQVVVDQAVLSQAIGRNGQNVKLASELTGWKISVVTAEEATQLQQEEASKVFENFSAQIGFDPELAQVLVEAGFGEAHELAYVDSAEFYALGFDEEIIAYIRSKAQEYLLRPKEKSIITQDINSVPGMHSAWVDIFKKHQVLTTDDLAELSIADLLEIVQCSEEEAAALIMAARSPWFSDDAQ